MAQQNYAAALKRVLVHEGGWSDHPKDPGGATMRGVTQAVYDGYRDRKSLPRQSVRHISEEELQAIYRTGYADKIAFDKLPVGVDYVVLDGAINSGPSQSVKWLQRALRMQAVDGVLGEATLAAVNAHPDYDLLIDRVCDIRLAFLKALRTWSTFGKGWSRRVDEVRRAGKAWATNRGIPSASPVEGGERRARLEDAKARPTKAPADAATGGGVATTGAGAALDQARETLSPLAGASDWIATVVTVLVVAGVVLTVGGLAYRWWQGRRAAELAAALDLPAAVAT